ncbi:MAG: NAD(P)H-hydrate dehydratase [Pseudomonadota bacterium]
MTIASLYEPAMLPVMSLAPNRVFTPKAMGRVDAQTIADGVPGHVLMDRAGQAVARLVLALRGKGHAVIFCGPGNNGGDGCVAARYLRQAGWTASLYSTVSVDELAGDAQHAAHLYAEAPQIWSPGDMLETKGAVFIDAVFGAGLARPLDQELAATLAHSYGAADISIAVDLPSGISGLTGATLNPEVTLQSDHSITFGGPKFGHYLMPGKALCGTLWLADIGLQAEALENEATGNLLGPHLLSGLAAWQPQGNSHKYERGHVGIVMGQGGRSGAGHLAGMAALRAGAGLVTQLGAADPPPLQAIMQAPLSDASDLAALVTERKISALVIGPGLGLDSAAIDIVSVALDLPLPIIFDADALTIIARQGWHHRVTANHILTPHAGEFSRLFPDAADISKIERLEAAIEKIAGVLCFKGPDTLIAQKGQRILINPSAPPALATAGSGDVLSGLIAAMIQGAPNLQTACGAGVYLHSEAAKQAGPGLIADDLPQALHSIKASGGFSL